MEISSPLLYGLYWWTTADSAVVEREASPDGNQHVVCFLALPSQAHPSNVST